MKQKNLNIYGHIYDADSEFEIESQQTFVTYQINYIGAPARLGGDPDLREPSIDPDVEILAIDLGDKVLNEFLNDNLTLGETFYEMVWDKLIAELDASGEIEV
jgi:hypothetical protein